MMPPAAPVSAPNRFLQLLSRAGLDWFLLALLGVVALAYARPGVGSHASEAGRSDRPPRYAVGQSGMSSSHPSQ